MMPYSPESNKTRSTSPLTATVFVDYQNVSGYLYGRTGPRGRPDKIIELVKELRRYLREEFAIREAKVTVYADFPGMHGTDKNFQYDLYPHGIDSSFAPVSMQQNATEIQICIDAADALREPLPHALVIVTGDRPYLPLVQHCKRHGVRPLVVSFSLPSQRGHASSMENDTFVNATNLLSDATRRTLSPPPSRPAPRSMVQSPPQRPQSLEYRDIEYREIEDASTLRALEIIHENFGQYSEIFLTPLLRKLSEVMGGDYGMMEGSYYDPKSLISDLEDSGAIWLEKRRGTPHDYTVLILDEKHPNVAAAQQRTYRSAPPSRYENTYDTETDVDQYDTPDDYDDNTYPGDPPPDRLRGGYEADDDKPLY